MDKLWVGLGSKVGGRVVFGVAKTVGVIYSMNDPHDRVRSAIVVAEDVSVGMALGGGVGLNVIVAWGYSTSQQINEVDLCSTDFALNIGVGGVGTYIKSLYEVGKAGKWAKYGGSILQFAKHWEKSKHIALELANNMKIHVSKPGIIFVAVPGAGAGLEAAIALQAGVVRTTQSMIVNFKDPWSVEQHLKTVSGIL